MARTGRLIFGIILMVLGTIILIAPLFIQQPNPCIPLPCRIVMDENPPPYLGLFPLVIGVYLVISGLPNEESEQKQVESDPD
jgi:cadmium resistance protein CadD (predicted permease)